jgi:hypothetical protein
MRALGSALQGANMMKATVLRIASFSLFFLLSVFALAVAQAETSGAAIEAPSPLSAIAHDFATWLNHVAGNGANNHRASSVTIAATAAGGGELVSHPVASNNQWSKFVPAPGASKKTTPTPVQINE